MSKIVGAFIIWIALIAIAALIAYVTKAGPVTGFCLGFSLSMLGILNIFRAAIK